MFHVAGRAAGPWLFSLINVTLLVATVAPAWDRSSGLHGFFTGWAGATRFQNPFSEPSNPNAAFPRNNVLFVGIVRSDRHNVPDF